mmetsp:Transcript_60583/g.145737  ORF Transcript_60583/g.145737 Transcript_60583/m.145737 type:complete len:211 (-) Transcript_60583:72-704(-)
MRSISTSVFRSATSRSCPSSSSRVRFSLSRSPRSWFCSARNASLVSSEAGRSMVFSFLTRRIVSSARCSLRASSLFCRIFSLRSSGRTLLLSWYRFCFLRMCSICTSPHSCLHTPHWPLAVALSTTSVMKVARKASLPSPALRASSTSRSASAARAAKSKPGVSHTGSPLRTSSSFSSCSAFCLFTSSLLPKTSLSFLLSLPCAVATCCA